METGNGDPADTSIELWDEEEAEKLLEAWREAEETNPNAKKVAQAVQSRTHAECRWVQEQLGKKAEAQGMTPEHMRDEINKLLEAEKQGKAAEKLAVSAEAGKMEEDDDHMDGTSQDSEDGLLTLAEAASAAQGNAVEKRTRAKRQRKEEPSSGETTEDEGELSSKVENFAKRGRRQKRRPSSSGAWGSASVLITGVSESRLGELLRDDKLTNTDRQRLGRFLSRQAARRWCFAEWLDPIGCSSSLSPKPDSPSPREAVTDAGIGSIGRLPRAVWSLLRARKLGKPRRLSRAFLAEQQTLANSQAQKAKEKKFATAIGAPCMAVQRDSETPRPGKVLTCSGLGELRVQFDSPELGHAVVNHWNVAHRPRVEQVVGASEVQNEAATPTQRQGSSRGTSDASTRGGKYDWSAPPPELGTVARLLDEKEATLHLLARLNDECERANDNGVNLSDSFRRKHSRALLQLRDLDSRLDNALFRLRARRFPSHASFAQKAEGPMRREKAPATLAAERMNATAILERPELGPLIHAAVGCLLAAKGQQAEQAASALRAALPTSNSWPSLLNEVEHLLSRASSLSHP